MRIRLLILLLLLLPETGAHAQSGEPRSGSNWRAEIKRNAFTDSLELFLSTVATGPVRTSYGTIRPTLYVHCAEGDLDVYLAVGVPTAHRYLEVRFDDGEVLPLAVYRSNDTRMLFVSEANRIGLQRLLNEMALARTLRARFAPSVHNPVMVRFNVAGLGPHLSTLEDAGCDPRPEIKLLGVTPAPPDARWVGDPLNRGAYPLGCPKAEQVLTLLRGTGTQPAYFPSREAVVQGGYDPVTSGCPSAPSQR